MWHEQLMRVQVSSAMLFDMVAAGGEFTINFVRWRHTSDSASERQRLFTMVFRWGIIPRVSRDHPPCLTLQFQCQSEVLCAEMPLEELAHPRRAPLCRPSGTASSTHGLPAEHMADEAAGASNLCYFVAIHEVLLPSHSLASNSPSLATTMGPAPATPFTGLELGPLLGKARPPKGWSQADRPMHRHHAVASSAARAVCSPLCCASCCAGRLRACVPGFVRRVHCRREGALTRQKATLQHSADGLVVAEPGWCTPVVPQA